MRGRSGQLALTLDRRDDAAFAQTHGRLFERRGYAVTRAANAAEMSDALARETPHYAVVNLKLDGQSGLACVKALHAHGPAMLIVVLTSYASIATAIEAVKLGACHYLAKPSNTDDIEAAFDRVDVSARATSLKTLEWERIHETLA